MNCAITWKNTMPDQQDDRQQHDERDDARHVEIAQIVRTGRGHGPHQGIDARILTETIRSAHEQSCLACRRLSDNAAAETLQSLRLANIAT